MQEDNRLNKVAEEIGQEIMAGEEIPLNQPFPEELKDGNANNDSGDANAEIAPLAMPVIDVDQNSDKSETNQPSDSQNKDNADENEKADKIDKKDDKQDPAKRRKYRNADNKINKLVLLFVGGGIFICLFGLILMIVASAITGIVCILFGAIVIAIGVLAPLGY